MNDLTAEGALSAGGCVRAECGQGGISQFSERAGGLVIRSELGEVTVKCRDARDLSLEVTHVGGRGADEADDSAGAAQQGIAHVAQDRIEVTVRLISISIRRPPILGDNLVGDRSRCLHRCPTP